MPQSIVARFPGAAGEWARFDGPAGTLMVDTAVEATRRFAADGDNANLGGFFAAAEQTERVQAAARHCVALLLGADPAGIVFGANMTTLTLAFTRAVARHLGPGDEIVCTQLDHDANVTPWVLAAADAGARVLQAPFDAATGRLPVGAIGDLLTERTRWVAVSGASNVIGTMPDVPAIVAAAHAVGAAVYVDAVHLTPHAAIDVGAWECDALVTSPYKWYGPHAGVLAARPDLLAELEPYKIRAAPDHGPDRWETGTASFETLAGVDAAAGFLLEEGMDTIAAAEQEVFGPLLDGLLGMDHVTVHGPHDLTHRTPTAYFSVAGMTADEVAARLAAAQIAVWSGHNYALDAVEVLGLAEDGGGVRAGVVRYVTAEDVARLLAAVERFS